MTISTLSFILAATKSNQSGGLASILILVLPMAALVYLMTVPQRKQRQKQSDMLRKVEVGDEVVTTGGIVGHVTHIEEELFHLEVDDDVVIRVAKNAISKNLNAPQPAEASKSRKGLLSGALGGASDGDSQSDSSAKAADSKKDTDA